MNPGDDLTLSPALREVLLRGGVTTREALEREVRSGALMQRQGVGFTLFREAEAWLRATATTTIDTCPTCQGVGVVTREKR
jgi:hypothetical protein